LSYETALSETKTSCEPFVKVTLTMEDQRKKDFAPGNGGESPKSAGKQQHKTSYFESLVHLFKAG
jgi:hypothetical protein